MSPELVTIIDRDSEASHRSFGNTVNKILTEHYKTVYNVENLRDKLK